MNLDHHAPNHAIGFKLTALALSVAMLFVVSATVSSAWVQPAHKEINRAAVKAFQETAAKSGKYRNAGVALDQNVDAPVVSSSGKFSMTYNQYWSFNSVESHIIEGGYSADEPNVYVSMKHFYDPLALSGKHELTDQETGHGWFYEAIPATEWALYRTDNPYSLLQAMRNYKKSMEIPSDASVSDMPVTGDFRDFAGNPKDLAEMRSMYLGKAMRGLGETMHLVADMTQPAHVRNDSHPGWEVTEEAINGPVASALTKFSRSDGLQGISFGNGVQEIMQTLATYTNRFFYSADTIADTASGLLPENGEIPYASPNFGLFTTNDFLGYQTLYQTFGNRKIPMLRKEPGALYGYNYEITPEFAIRQGEVLFPLAVAANTRVMDLFFPTLVLKMLVQPVAVDPDMLMKAKEAGAEDLKQYEAAITLDHEIAKDPQWSAENLKIEYSGPGEIWRIRNGRHQKLAEVEFHKGVVVSYQDPESGEQRKGNPVFYMPLGGDKVVTMTGPMVDYTVEMGDSLYATATSGARILSGNAYTFELEEPEIRIQADRDRIMPGEAVVFEAEVENPPERYVLEWTFGDEESETETNRAPVRNRKLTMKHVYEKEQECTATVRLIDLKRRIVRTSDTVNVSCYMGELAGAWDLTLHIQEENKFFRSMLVGFMKILIQGIISPLAQALGGEAVDPSAAENFTMVGAQLLYSLELRKLEDQEGAYAGPLTYVGTTTNGIEGTQDIQSLRLEMRKGVMVFIARATTEEGLPVEFVFLRNGRMTSPGQLEGTFEIPGVMSGSWDAVMK